MISALLLVLLAQSSTPQRDARPAAPAATGTISGVITSADAQPTPLRRARVTLSSAAMNMPRTIVTADDGAFMFDGVPVGRYALAALKEGYVSMNYGATRPGRGGTEIAVTAAQSVRVAIALPRGAVITGTVSDIDGAPAQGITVAALGRRYVRQSGEWRYLAAGVAAGTTDDRGVYRIYGLPAGEYVISAQPQARAFGLPGTEVRRVANGADSSRPLIMTQVLYPGVTTIPGATRIAVRAGEERGGIDVALQYVPVAAVSGVVSMPPGWTPSTVTLARVDEVPGFEPIRMGHPDGDGRFTLSRIPPGQYRLVARSVPAARVVVSDSSVVNLPGNQMFGAADITIEGEDVSNVALTGQPGVSVAGQLVFEGRNPPVAIPAQLSMPLVMPMGSGGFVVPPLVIEGNRFKAEGIFPGTYGFVGQMRGVRTPIGQWWLKSFVIGGREVLDAPINLRQSVDDAVATFSDRASELSGLVDAPAGVATDAWVIAAPMNRDAWFFNSRRIAAVHPDGEGHYTIRNLPPGDYRVLVTRDIDEGEWFDPSVLERLLPSGTAVTIAGVEKLTVNLKKP